MDDVYIVAYEAGAGNTPVPAWTSAIENPISLSKEPENTIERVEIDAIPGAFQLLNVLSTQECERLVSTSEEAGYTEDASISLPRSVRHNENFVWVCDETTHDILWKRCHNFIDETFDGNKKPLGVNRRFRFYKYKKGDFFSAHMDGAWPGSAVINKKLISDAFCDRYSQMTFLLFLSEGYKGGQTQFWVDHEAKPAKKLEGSKRIQIRTPLGGALCFPHGTHPLRCLHSSEEVLEGVKYIIRTDLLFET